MTYPPQKGNYTRSDGSTAWPYDSVDENGVQTVKATSEITHIGGTAQAGRDWSQDLSKLDIALSALRDAIAGAGGNAKTLNDLHAKIESVLAATLTVSGTVGVNNFPATQPVSGTVDVSDKPARELGRVVAEIAGSKSQKESSQETELATTVETYTKAAGATEIGVYCESGLVRVRTDGDPATDQTGTPIAEGFYQYFSADEISVYYAEESVITVVSQ